MASPNSSLDGKNLNVPGPKANPFLKVVFRSEAKVEVGVNKKPRPTVSPAVESEVRK